MNPLSYSIGLEGVTSVDYSSIRSLVAGKELSLQAHSLDCAESRDHHIPMLRLDRLELGVGSCNIRRDPIENKHKVQLAVIAQAWIVDTQQVVGYKLQGRAESKARAKLSNPSEAAVDAPI
jgi:hypothetical protein